MTTFSELTLPGASDAIEVIVHGAKPTQPQRAAITHAKKGTLRVTDAVVAAFPSLRARLPRPKTITTDTLSRHASLRELIVTTDHADGVAYVAYGFECDWDPSGFYVAAHGDRVVAIGDEDVLELPIRDPMRVARAPKLPTKAARAKARLAAAKAARRNPRTPPRDLEGELTVTLATWASFVAGPGRAPSRGQITLTIAADEQRAYRHVLRGAKATQRLVLDAIAKKHPGHVLQDCVELRAIFVHRRRITQIGYQLDCAWDREHGLGVLVRGERVIAIGQADTAFSPR